jgi:UDP-3-O-[3-hydroxymyristoyl] N-acetylglucosamine deacetylase/3-hydroxyacyl-[acyl-carrier-protein] dehydratase
MIHEAGVVAQDERREVFRVQTPVLLEQGETTLSVFPHDGFKISCTSAGAGGRHTQFYSVEVTPESWEREIGHARTFCFFEEIEALIKNGLIKGGSLENAVVIRDDAVLTTEPLRYPEEFVRHKILDIIGDLSLAGRPMAGHVIAVRPGHAANCEFARRLNLEMRKPLEAAQSFSPPPTPPAAPGEAPPQIQDGQGLDNARLMKILPHRYPFLMVDKITKIDGPRITGVKNVTINEPYFQGHFPNHPIMPGVLQLEAIAQVAGVLMLRQAENFGKLAYFMSAESVRWRKPVRPGDALVIEVELTKSRGKIGKARGVCSVDGETVSEAEVTFMLFDRQ